MGRWYLRQLREAADAPVFVIWENAGGAVDASVAGSGLVVYVNPELQRLRVLVEAARGRLAELEADFPVEKAQVEAMKARLFVRLRDHFQRRDRLRDIIQYRRKFLEMLVRHGEEEAAQVKEEYRRASAHGAARFQPPLKPMRRRSTRFRDGGGIGPNGGRSGASRGLCNGGWKRAAPWESIELEIVRVLEAINDLRESSNYELHRLTERSPELGLQGGGQ